MDGEKMSDAKPYQPEDGEIKKLPLQRSSREESFEIIEDPVPIITEAIDLLDTEQLSDKKINCDMDVEVREMDKPKTLLPTFETKRPEDPWPEELKDAKMGAVCSSCPHCLTSYAEGGKFCPGCGHQYILPRGVTEQSKVNFRIPSVVGTTLPALHAILPHDESPPGMYGVGDDISQNYDINTWVLNHLPVDEDTKLNLIRTLTGTQRRQASKDRVALAQKEQYRQSKQSKIKLHKVENRSCVKSLREHCS